VSQNRAKSVVMNLSDVSEALRQSECDLLICRTRGRFRGSSVALASLCGNSGYSSEPKTKLVVIQFVVAGPDQRWLVGVSNPLTDRDHGYSGSSSS
jgi:hypothetical protein